MTDYKITNLETLALEIIKSPTVYEVDLATDFDIDHEVGDIVDEYETSCFYHISKLYIADTILCVCVYYGGQCGTALLFDIGACEVKENELDAMVKDLSHEFKTYLSIYGDNLVAVQITE